MEVLGFEPWPLTRCKCYSSILRYTIQLCGIDWSTRDLTCGYCIQCIHSHSIIGKCLLVIETAFVNKPAECQVIHYEVIKNGNWTTNNTYFWPFSQQIWLRNKRCLSVFHARPQWQESLGHRPLVRDSWSALIQLHLGLVMETKAYLLQKLLRTKLIIKRR